MRRQPRQRIAFSHRGRVGRGERPVGAAHMEVLYQRSYAAPSTTSKSPLGGTSGERKVENAGFC